MARKAPGWHGLGEVFDEFAKVSASEAVRKVTKGVEIVSRPVYAMIDEQDGIKLNLAQKAIIRKPTDDDPQYRVFGVVGADWSQIDYVSLAERLDPLSREYKVETAGLLKEGGLCFLSLRGPDFDVSGDQMNDYYIVNLSNLPGVSHRAFSSKVRVVCNNTNTMAISQASIDLAIPHTANAEARLAFATELIAKFRTVTAKSKEIFERFASVQITEANLHLLLEAAWPEPSMPNEVKMLHNAAGTADENLVRAAFGDRIDTVMKLKDNWHRDVRRAHAIRKVGVERFEAFDPARLRGSVWAAYNAVTEVSDWRESFGSDVGVSILFGNRAKEKQRAYAHAMELIK